MPRKTILESYRSFSLQGVQCKRWDVVIRCIRGNAVSSCYFPKSNALLSNPRKAFRQSKLWEMPNHDFKAGIWKRAKLQESNLAKPESEKPYKVYDMESPYLHLKVACLDWIQLHDLSLHYISTLRDQNSGWARTQEIWKEFPYLLHRIYRVCSKENDQEK